MAKLSDNLELAKCPMCAITRPNLRSVYMAMMAAHDGSNKRYWRVYNCNSCGGIMTAAAPNDQMEVTILYPPELQRDEDALQIVTYLDGEVASDFKEALICFENSCWNAFAAMCRRTVQSIAEDNKVQGTSKVEAQLKELKEMGQIDDSTFDVLKQVILSGHDGAHPHLPSLNPARAGVLLELMKDVLYQLYVRKKKIEQAMQMRKQVIDEMKTP